MLRAGTGGDSVDQIIDPLRAPSIQARIVAVLRIITKVAHALTIRSFAATLYVPRNDQQL